MSGEDTHEDGVERQEPVSPHLRQAAFPQTILDAFDETIDAHMQGKPNRHMDNERMEWALTVQRATRLYLWQLRAPGAQAWWGRWRGGKVRDDSWPGSKHR